MSSSKGFSKRLGFKRTNTDQEAVTVTSVAPKGTEDATANSHIVAGNGDANSIIDEVVRVSIAKEAVSDA